MSTRFTPKWLVISIDLATVAVSFFMAYLIRFNFNLNFDLSKFWIQLPVVLLITLMAFLVTGFYKEVSRNAAGDTGKIFKATGLSVVLVLLLILGNR
ncbi:MAG: polysaccharide biosynthesis protein, partial [Robiginitalea sp.]